MNTTGAQRDFLAPGASQTLRIGWPAGKEEQQCFEEIVRLVQVFGAVGGRSRNGWGSVWFEGESVKALDLGRFLDPGEKGARAWLGNYARKWQDAIRDKTDWCHAVGKDEQGLLLWRTSEQETWEAVLTDWAKAKIAFRTQFGFSERGTPSGLRKRHLLAYPITRHPYKAVSRESAWHRSANQVVFKVLALPAGDYVGLVAHLPHALPRRLRAGVPRGEWNGLQEMEQAVWRRVHEKLDDLFTRLP